MRDILLGFTSPPTPLLQRGGSREDETLPIPVVVTRVVALELERLYNHLWTLGALANDVGQSFILNGFLAVREQILDLNQAIFGSRTLQGVITFGGVKKILSSDDGVSILQTLASIEPRLLNLIDMCKR